MCKTKYIIAILLIVATATLYLPIKKHSFINFDDNIYVTQNPTVKQGLTWEGVKWAFRPDNDARSYWHPLTWISHMLDCQIFGVRSDIHHLVNLLFHLINVLLLFILLSQLTGSLWKSAFVAALFAIHPINVDSVAWIAERKNLLSTLFWFASIMAYAHYAKRPSLYRYSLIVIALALGLMAKTMLVTIPCVLLLFDYWPLGRLRWGQQLPAQPGKKDEAAEKSARFQAAPLFRLIAEKLPLLAICLAAMALSIISIRGHSAMVDMAHTSMPLRIANALVSYVMYLKKMVWPNDLAVFYPFPGSIPAWKPVVAGLFIILITYAVFFRARKTPALAVGWLWYLGTLFPVIGLMQGGLWPAMADRWAYIPLVGIFIMIAWGTPEFVQGLKARNYILPICATVVLLFLGFKTSIQLGFWKNDYTLFKHAMEVTDRNCVAHSLVAACYERNGDIQEAEFHYKEAIDSNPYYHDGLKNYSFFLLHQGDYNQAKRYFSKALWIFPQSYELYIGLGNVFLKLNEPARAAYNFSMAMRLAPHDSFSYNERGNAYLQQGRPDLAIREYSAALVRNPDNPDFHFNLGLAEQMNGNLPKALDHYRSALAIDPGNVRPHLKIAEILFQQGNMQEAQKHYQAALQIEPDSASIHYNLGIVLAQTLHTEEALRQFRIALKLDPKYEKAAQAMTLMGK